MSILKHLLREWPLLVALLLTGGVLYTSGFWGLRAAKQGFWQEKITPKKEYRRLSAKQRDGAYREFLRPWAASPGDEFFRKVPLAHVLYALQAVGEALLRWWWIIYGAVLVWGERGRFKACLVMKPPGTREFWWYEGIVLGTFIAFGLVWYITWGWAVPQAYMFFKTVAFGSYAYLWDGKLAWFYDVAGLAGWVVTGYVPFFLWRLFRTG